MSSSLKNKGE